MKFVKQRGIDEYVQATHQIEALGSKDDSFYVEKGAFWQTITIKYHSKKHILHSTSRKRVDDADAFNDLSVIHVFGQQRFATGGFSRADNQ